MEAQLLRALPKMDVLLAHPALAGSPLPYAALRQAARERLDALRSGIRAGSVTALPSLDTLAAQVLADAGELCRPHLRRVVNATGVVLHTNLGRAPLAEEAARAAYDAGRQYTNLEYDLPSGARGSRHAHVEGLLCSLTGAEAALVVNNNAAAVFLMLSALARGRGVAVSRGELVEIGGAFRMPDIMDHSGATLCEVGTTNKTRLGDYAAALHSGRAQLLLKVHTSNYRIVGFTEDTPLSALAVLGREAGAPVLYDLGSGALRPLPGLPEGPTVSGALAAGADVVCFSGDKLLGGPQAGLAVGRREYIERMKRDPFARVVRADKLTLAALEATLRAWADPERTRSLPALSALAAGEEDLRRRAQALAGRLAQACPACAFEAVPAEGQVGGGSLPGAVLPGWAAAADPAPAPVNALEQALRGWEVPVLGRIAHGRLLLDVRTLLPGDENTIAAAFAAWGAGQ
ncbi:MAG TPA: L-seryl-tRNA(Sec) selenium transferase [Candidatus Galloscillospira excrementavium]|nr:L-seryl-tRNA(Sec) selenium transferase [Candidatus Galloscillospira excrementavium]